MSDDRQKQFLEELLGEPDFNDEVKFNTGPIGVDPNAPGCLAFLLALGLGGILATFTDFFDAIFSFLGSLF